MSLARPAEVLRGHAPRVRCELGTRRSEPGGYLLRDPCRSHERVPFNEGKQGKEVEKDLPRAERREPGGFRQVPEQARLPCAFIAESDCDQLLHIGSAEAERFVGVAAKVLCFERESHRGRQSSRL